MADLKEQKSKGYKDILASPRFQRCFLIFLLLVSLAVTLKILLVGYDIDEQYALAMSYRIINGDFLFLDMWEPHQTSGFLSAFLMLPYLLITHSTNGIVLYLRICGMLIHLGVTYFLSHYLKSYLEKFPRILICGIFFFSLPKLMFYPDFANMQIWFLVLMILSLSYYYQEEEEHSYSSLICLVTAGGCMALEVLSYPLTLPVFPCCVICIIFYHKKKRLVQELLAFCLPCIAGAVAYLILFLSRMNLSTLIEMFRMVLSDGSHSAPFSERLLENIISLGEILLFIGIYSLISLAIYFLVRRKIPYCYLLMVCTLLGQVIIWIFGRKYPNFPMIEYFLVPAFAFIFLIRKKLRFSRSFTFFILIPFIAFCGIVFATNHPLLVSAPFLGVCVTGVLIQPELWKNEQIKHSHMMIILSLWLIVMLFGKGFLVRTTGGEHYTVFQPIKIIRQGPATGTLADEQTAIRCRDNYQLVQNHIPDGASLFYMGSSNDVYLWKDLIIATPSTLSTPCFDDKYNVYFEMHPDKMPEYVIYDKSTKAILSPEWAFNYIISNCEQEAVAENDYMTIYRVKTESQNSSSSQ